MKSRSRAATVMTATVLAAVLAACSSSAGTSSDATSAEVPGSLAVRHVHSLGIDPADGRLYVATHEGVISVADDGTTQRVGDTADYMGFTVIGAKTFLGSGHPA